MSSNEELDFVKDEANYFMDKTFQVSFGYLAALIGVLAISTTKGIGQLGEFFRITPGALLAVAVLALNIIYLTVAFGCMCATLKRGNFLIREDRSRLRQWEQFVRQMPGDPGEASLLKRLDWNMDNYFMVPVHVLIFLISVGALLVGLAEANNLAVHIVVWSVFLLHGVPLMVLSSVAKLNNRCRNDLAADVNESAAEPE